MVLGHDPLHLRLLEHDLRDEDVVRVGGAAPRQVAPMATVPAEQARAGSASGRAASGRDGGAARRPLCTSSAERPPQVDTRPRRDNNDGCMPAHRAPPSSTAVRHGAGLIDRSALGQGHRDRARSASIPPGHAQQRREGPPPGQGVARRLPRRSRQGHGAARGLRARGSAAARAAREPHREDAPDASTTISSRRRPTSSRRTTRSPSSSVQGPAARALLEGRGRRRPRPRAATRTSR